MKYERKRADDLTAESEIRNRKREMFVKKVNQHVCLCAKMIRKIGKVGARNSVRAIKRRTADKSLSSFVCEIIKVGK